MIGRNLGFGNDYENHYGHEFGRGQGYCGRGLRRRFAMLDESLTGLDYDLFYTLSNGEKDATTLLKDVSTLRGNKNFPVLGCINLHLKELSELGYVEMVDKDGKKYYKLTESGKKLMDVY